MTMTRDEAESELRRPERFEEYLREHYAELEHKGKMCCFVHEEKTPSMTYTAMNRREGFIKCFGCGASFDIFSLYAHDNGLDSGRDFAKIIDGLSDDFGLEVEKIGGGRVRSTSKTTAKAKTETRSKAPTAADYSKELDEWRSHIHDAAARKYLEARHITEQTADFFGLGYDVKRRALIIPTGDGKHYYKVRYLSKGTHDKDKYNAIGGQVLFNARELYSGEPVFITEGELNAISIHQAGGRAAALGSTENAGKLLQLIDERKPTGTLVLALDNDDTGRNKAKGLEAELQRRGVPHILADVEHLYNGMGDANDALKKDEEALKEAISHYVAEAETSSFEASSDNGKDDAELSFIDVEHGVDEESYKTAVEKQKEAQRHGDEIERGAVRLVNAFTSTSAFNEEIRARANRPTIKTFDYALDALLEGGLYEGLYILGAVPAAGKTTFALQLADTIAKNGRDILFFSLEMSAFELMARSLSRLSFERYAKKNIPISEQKPAFDAGLSVSDILNCERGGEGSASSSIYEAIANAQTTYNDYSSRITIAEGNFGVGVKTISETVERYITEHGGERPVVFVDYLQILASDSDNNRATDKQKADDATVELKRLSRRHKVPVIAISSFNRDAYGNPPSLKSMKESGGIEYGADVVLSLYHVEKKHEADEHDGYRDVDLDILKQRNGRSGYTIHYCYVAKYNVFIPRAKDSKDEAKDLEAAAIHTSIVGLRDHKRIERTPRRNANANGKRQHSNAEPKA